MDNNNEIFFYMKGVNVFETVMTRRSQPGTKVDEGQATVSQNRWKRALTFPWKRMRLCQRLSRLWP